MPNTRVSFACGPQANPEALRFMWHNPNVIEEKSWWSFFYTSHLDYLNNQVKGQHDQEIIGREWLMEAKVNITPEVKFEQKLLQTVALSLIEPTLKQLAINMNKGTFF